MRLIMPEIRIDSLDDPRLDVYRSLKKTNQTRCDELFIAEGTTVVERLFRSPFAVQSLLITDQRLAEFRTQIPDDVVVYRLSKDLATLLVGYTFHMGVLAAGCRQPSPSLHSALPEAGPSLVLFGDHIIDPQNVGLLIRIAAAFGADALVLSSGSADPFSRRAIRVSMGNGLFLPIIRATDAEQTLRELGTLNYSRLATVLADDAVELATFPFPERSVLIFGNETHGVSPSILTHCDTQLTVSMLNGTDSLNVAISAGIFAYAWRASFPSPVVLKE